MGGGGGGGGTTIVGARICARAPVANKIATATDSDIRPTALSCEVRNQIKVCEILPSVRWWRRRRRVRPHPLHVTAAPRHLLNRPIWSDDRTRTYPRRVWLSDIVNCASRPSEVVVAIVVLAESGGGN